MKSLRAILFAICLCGFMQANAFEIQETEVDGTKIWFSENQQNPIIVVNLAFENAGNAYDPQEKLGLAYFVSAMLNEGAGKVRSPEFLQMLEDNSIAFAPNVDGDNFYISVKTLSINSDVAIDLLNLAITQPNFEAQDFERIKKQIITELNKKQEDATEVAADEFRAKFFGEHEYAKPKEGLVSSVEKITPQDLHEFVAQHFAVSNLRIAFAGDITDWK